MNTTNKQDVVRTQLAKEFIVQNLRGEKRLLPIKDYAERFKVGLGTVQSALNDLKASGAVTLNACGSQGTFLGDVDQKALWNMSGYGILVALLPLDTDPGIKGLATGLYEAFTHYDLPIHILFARGSANRTDILLRGKCDFAVMSELAYHHAQAIGKPVLKVGEIGRRACPYGVLLPRNGTHSTPLRMAYDSYSYEQEALIRLLGWKEHSYGGCLGVQLADLVRAGEVEAALVNRESAAADQENFEFRPLNGLPSRVEEQLDRSIVVVSQENQSLADLLSIVASRALIDPVQEAVVRGERFVKY